MFLGYDLQRHMRTSSDGVGAIRMPVVLVAFIELGADRIWHPRGLSPPRHFAAAKEKASHAWS